MTPVEIKLINEVHRIDFGWNVESLPKESMILDFRVLTGKTKADPPITTNDNRKTTNNKIDSVRSLTPNDEIDKTADVRMRGEYLPIKNIASQYPSTRITMLKLSWSNGVDRIVAGACTG
jgi:hypothetical protein